MTSMQVNEVSIQMQVDEGAAPTGDGEKEAGRKSDPCGKEKKDKEAIVQEAMRRMAKRQLANERR